MTLLSKKIQRMNERATEIRQALQAAPAKAAELRGAVTAAAGQMRQVRSEIKATVADVSSAARGSPPPLPKAGESATAKTLRDVEAAEEVVKEAGYTVDSMTLEVATGQVRVRLWCVAEVRLVDIRAVLELYAKTPVEKALVTGLIEATEMASGVALGEHSLAEVWIDPETGEVLRLGWRAVEAEQETPSPAPAPQPGTAPAPVFAQSSFFARPASPAAAPVVAGTASASPAPVSARVEPTQEAAKPAAPSSTPAHSRSSALDRFKKMPDLTKK